MSAKPKMEKEHPKHAHHEHKKAEVKPETKGKTEAETPEHNEPSVNREKN